MKDKIYSLFVIAGEYALYGLLFFLSISNALVESFAGLALFGFVGRKIIKPDFKFLKSLPNNFIFLFLLFNALSMFNSGLYFNKSLHALIGKWLQYLGIYLIFQDSIYCRKIVKRGIYIFLFGASLAVFSGLSQYFFGLEFLRGRFIASTTDGIRAITSSFTYYNAFGGYLVVVLSLIISLLLGESRFSLKVFSLSILSVLATCALILTFSRGSWLAMALSFIFICFFPKKGFKWLIPTFLMVAIMFWFPIFQERLLLIFKEGGDSDRFRYWLVALKMIKGHPFFGTGVGTFMSNFPKYLPACSVSYAHNCFLQIWAETGLFSFISFILFMSSLLYLGVKKFFTSRDFLLLGLLSGLIGFLTHSFFDTDLYSLRLAVLFWLYAGLAAGRIGESSKL